MKTSWESSQIKLSIPKDAPSGKVKKMMSATSHTIKEEPEPGKDANIDNVEIDSSNPGAGTPKGNPSGTVTSNIKYIIPRTNSSPYVHPKLNKGLTFKLTNLLKFNKHFISQLSSANILNNLSL
ncbi:hypothetical protein RYX36_016789 [Vicia faba]